MRADPSALLLALVASLALAGCGGAPPPQRSQFTPPPLDVVSFLRTYGAARVDALADHGDVEALEVARREASGPDRREVMRNLAYAHLWAAEIEQDERAKRRHHRDAERTADRAGRRSRDADLAAEVAFVGLWSSWRRGTNNAAARAERFTTRHRSAGELVNLAWIIRGEIAMAAGEYDVAKDAYRFLMGHLDHPLYAFCLFRTAEAQRALGRMDEAHQAFVEVAELGCAVQVADETLRMAVYAASETGVGSVRDANGMPRPSSCTLSAAIEDDEEGGDEEWTPPE